MYDQILEIIKTNEFFQGGFLVAVISGILMYLRSIPSKIYRLFNRYSTLYLALPDSSSQFNWVALYVNDLYSQSNYGKYTIVNRKGKVYTSIGDHRYLKVGSFCWVKFIFTERELDNKSGGEDAFAYSMSLKFYGLSKRKNLSELLSKAKVLHGPKKGRNSIRKWEGGFWNHVCYVPQRTMQTVYSDAMHEVFEDILSFQTKRELYESKGIPFRRGYMFFGPPGTGKTSSVSALVNELDLTLHTINLSSISGGSLIKALSSDNKLIVFEDIDAVSAAEKRSAINSDRIGESPTIASPPLPANEEFKAITLSELLNAIDGSMTGSNLIFIFTSNHPEKLDPALLRPGRIDRKVHFGYMSQAEFSKMTKVYFDKDCGDHLVRDNLVAAEAQNNYLTHGDYDTFMDYCCTRMVDDQSWSKRPKSLVVRQ